MPRLGPPVDHRVRFNRIVATQTTRRLGTFERAETLTAERFAFNVVVVLRLTGELPEEALRRALDEVQRRHPLLRARITGAGRRRAFEVGEVEPIPLRAVERAAEGDWLERVEEELVAGFAIDAGPLARALRVGGQGVGEPFELVLTFHHAIVDATAIHHLVGELLALCSGRDDSRPPPQALPPSADALFPRAFRAPWRWPRSLRFLTAQAVDELGFRRHSRGRERPVLDRPAACQVLSLALSEAETTALVRATRRRRVGLYAALNAAMLLALVERRHGNRAGPHRYFAFPLLRSYLEPPVGDDVVAGYLTTLRLTLALEPAAGLWPAAEAIHLQVDRAAKRGERYLASRWSAASMALLLGQPTRMGTTALNYAGATPLEVAASAPFTVEGYHAFVSDFPRGPEYTGQSRIFDRRLWFDIVYLDTDMDRDEAQAIAERMCALLTASVAEEVGSSA